MIDLRCYSFHSVKGGAGKTTLATLVALQSARTSPTLLVDMDLTGTSLADVLPIEAPTWSANASRRRTSGKTRAADKGPSSSPISTDSETSGPKPLPIDTAPDGFLSLDETQRGLEARNDSDVRRTHVPLLNDFLLYADEQWDESRDVHVEALCWRIGGTQNNPDPFPNLRVIPSSALPVDLYQILPLIFDEPFAGFLEGRLEWFLNEVLEHGHFKTVVFDTPPAIPGLSQSVLSLGLRLPRFPDPEAELSEDGGTPPRLLRSSTRWTPCLVTTGDLQDLRAAQRWYDRGTQKEQDAIKVVVNRLVGTLEERKRRMAPVSLEIADAYDIPFLEDAFAIEPQVDMAFNLFLEGRVPETLPNLVDEFVTWLDEGTEHTS